VQEERRQSPYGVHLGGIGFRPFLPTSGSWTPALRRRCCAVGECVALSDECAVYRNGCSVYETAALLDEVDDGSTDLAWISHSSGRYRFTHGVKILLG
jgi:hypothetical protein